MPEIRFMSEIKFIVPGQPVGKALKVYVPKGAKFATIKNTETSGNYMDLVTYAALNAINQYPRDWWTLDYPIGVDLVAVFQRPKNLLERFKKTGELKNDAKEERMPYIKKPDVDNISKSILDGCTHAGIWRDDCLVCEQTVKKYFAAINESPHTEITIRW